MPTSDRVRMARRASSIGVLGAIAIVIVVVVRWGRERGSPPARCPSGLVSTLTRCCAQGQSERGGACVGTPRACPAGFALRTDGCVVLPTRVRITAGTVHVGPGDWEASGQVEVRDIAIGKSFEIDAFEVTEDRWRGCVEAGQCEGLARKTQSGCPVRGIAFEQALRFCRWAGGSVPTDDAWVMAAAGTSARRYPWGDAGAVCRRADWGRLHGPCAHDASGPEWAGLIAADRTPRGVVGLAGGVAEWVQTRDGSGARGGSWKSALATELRTWRRQHRSPDRGYDDLGVRCVYP